MSINDVNYSIASAIFFSVLVIILSIAEKSIRGVYISSSIKCTFDAASKLSRAKFSYFCVSVRYKFRIALSF